MFPLYRNRRLRQSAVIRNLVRETVVTPNDFLVPIFVTEGNNQKQEIPSMPDYFCYSLDTLKEEVKELWSLGLKAVLLFARVPNNLKDNKATEALNHSGLMQRAVKTIKEVYPEMLVMTDVALDPYSIYGHDGIVENGKILNDETVAILAKMAVSHALAGADFVAPSDMMDGRVAAIRKALDQENFTQTGIMSYSVKYASAFYGPFRDALNSAPVDMENVPKDKKTYQMDVANRIEALRQANIDINQGADIIMIKPGLCYLDIVRDIKESTTAPLAVYQVSGEYAMLKAAAEKGWLNQNSVMLEQLTAIKRAGADIIASYFAKEAIKLISSI